MPAQKPKGFTLIELMVSIAIIAVLAAVGMVVYSAAQKSGRISKRVQDLDAFRTALELYKATNGFYPSVPNANPGVAAGWACIDTLATVNSLTPSYMPQIPKDPIQSGSTNCYQYNSDDGTAGAADPGATIYKVRTNIPNTEMSYTDLNQQPAFLDPAHDQTTANGCTIDLLTGNAASQGWAVYSSTAAACAY